MPVLPPETCPAAEKPLLRARAPVSPRLLGVEDAGKMLGIGLSSVYRLIGRGELDGVKIDDRSLIPVESMDKFIATRQKVKVTMLRGPRHRKLGASTSAQRL